MKHPLKRDSVRLFSIFKRGREGIWNSLKRCWPKKILLQHYRWNVLYDFKGVTCYFSFSSNYFGVFVPFPLGNVLSCNQFLKMQFPLIVQRVSEGKYHLLKAYQVSLFLVLFLPLIVWKPVHFVLNLRTVIWRSSSVAYTPLRRQNVSKTSIGRICSLYKVVRHYWHTGDSWLQFASNNFVKITFKHS